MSAVCRVLDPAPYSLEHDADRFLNYNVLVDWINANDVLMVLSRSRDIRDIRLHRDQRVSEGLRPSFIATAHAQNKAHVTH